MLTKTAIRIFVHEKWKYAGVVVGVAMALFLLLLQSGFYFGFIRDITVVSDSFDADLWISQQHLLSIDYVSQMDDLPAAQALSDEGVATVMPVIYDWSLIRILPHGATEEGKTLGVDLSSRLKLDLHTQGQGDLAALLSAPGNILVDAKQLSRIGVRRPGDAGVEIRGLSANVVGVMHDKKLFTGACLVVTDLDNARRFLGLKPNQISFVAVKCQPGADLRATQARLQSKLREQRVWTTEEFRGLTQRYWLKLTGIGPVLLLSAALATLVGFLTVFLTFYHLTSEKLPLYAALKAIGASTGELSALVLLQIGTVFGLGFLLAVAGVMVALAVLANTTISVILTPGVAILGVGFMALCSLAAGLKSLRTLAAVEPAEAFRT
jgi:putative ABC transport system permease protein